MMHFTLLVLYFFGDNEDHGFLIAAKAVYNRLYPSNFFLSVVCVSNQLSILSEYGNGTTPYIPVAVHRKKKLSHIKKNSLRWTKLPLLD